MAKHLVLAGQNIYDVCILQYGTLEVLEVLQAANGLGLNDDIAQGMELILPEFVSPNKLEDAAYQKLMSAKLRKEGQPLATGPREGLLRFRIDQNGDLLFEDGGQDYTAELDNADLLLTGANPDQFAINENGDVILTT